MYGSDKFYQKRMISRESKWLAPKRTISETVTSCLTHSPSILDELESASPSKVAEIFKSLLIQGETMSVNDFISRIPKSSLTHKNVLKSSRKLHSLYRMWKIAKDAGLYEEAVPDHLDQVKQGK